MAACVKSFVSLFLLVGMLSLLTVSASGEDVKVTFVAQQYLADGMLKIVGNSSELGNSNVDKAPIMSRRSEVFWVLTVPLTRGVTYQVNLVVWNYYSRDDPDTPYVCYCDPMVVTVSSTDEYPVVALNGYDCSVACPGDWNMIDPIRRVV